MILASSESIDRVLAAYAPIGLAEIGGVSLMNRVDTKYLLNEEVLASVLRAVAEDYRVLEVEGVRRSPYTTLYFDTPSRQCYQEHHNGKASRRKFRMRTYVASGVSFFEVKTKNNRGRTLKQRIAIPAIEEKLDGEAAALAESIAGEPVSLLPQLWTVFRRITLVGHQTVERVTLDTDLEFRAGDRRSAWPGAVIAEVKQERQSRNSPLRQSLREHHVRPMRVSKYCLGSAALDPTLKQNNFKTKLLSLQETTC